MRPNRFRAFRVLGVLALAGAVGSGALTVLTGLGPGRLLELARASRAPARVGAAHLRAFGGPLALEHFRQPVDHHVQEAAHEQPENAAERSVHNRGVSQSWFPRS